MPRLVPDALNVMLPLKLLPVAELAAKINPAAVVEKVTLFAYVSDETLERVIFPIPVLERLKVELNVLPPVEILSVALVFVRATLPLKVLPLKYTSERLPNIPELSVVPANVPVAPVINDRFPLEIEPPLNVAVPYKTSVNADKSREPEFMVKLFNPAISSYTGLLV